MNKELYAPALAIGAQEWQRRLEDHKLFNERLPLESRMDPPPIPDDMLNPWASCWPTPDAHLEAVRGWVDGDTLMLSAAVQSISEMKRIRQFAVTSGGTGDMARLELRAALQHARFDSPRFDSVDHAIEAARPQCKNWMPEQFLWHFGNTVRRVIPVALYLLAPDMSDDTLTRLVYPTWTWAGRPMLYVKRSHWRELFRRAGFTVDGQPADPPNGGPIVMYRASNHANRFNFDWTSELRVATLYAGMRGAQIADVLGPAADDIQIWRMHVPPENLLALGTAGGGHEWVIDTSLVGNLGRTLPISLVVA